MLLIAGGHTQEITGFLHTPCSDLTFILPLILPLFNPLAHPAGCVITIVIILDPIDGGKHSLPPDESIFTSIKMASKQTFSLLTFSLGLSLPLLIDLAYQEAYLVPTTTPNLYTRARLEELIKPVKQPFSMPPSLTFTRYHTENSLHAQYVHAKKSLWRYNVMWGFLGVVSAALQGNYVVNSLIARRPAAAVAAVSAMGLTWAAIIVEGNARRLYLKEMHDEVMKEEEAFKS